MFEQTSLLAPYLSGLGLTDVLAITAAGDENLVPRKTAPEWGWGKSKNGQFGDWTSQDRDSPGVVQKLAGVTQLFRWPPVRFCEGTGPRNMGLG